MSSPTQSAPEDSVTDASTPAVRATCTVPAPVEKVWEHLISPGGTQALLGPGALLGSKGESWHSADGPHGVVRSYHPLEQIRVSWHADDDAPPSLVDLQLVRSGDSTRLDLVHERLTPADSPPALQSRWDGALDRFASALTG